MPKLKRIALVLVLLTVATPATARADWLLAPYVGGILLDITDTGTRPTVGGSVSWIGRVAGFEVDFGDAHGFLESTHGRPIDQSNLLSLMGKRSFSSQLHRAVSVRTRRVVSACCRQT